MKCIIADKMHESILPMLEELGVEALYAPNVTRPELLEVIGDYDGLIIRSKTKIDREFVASAHRLKWIARAGAGIDKLDVTAIENAGIYIFNAPEGNRNAVGEHVLGMLLSMMNHLAKSDREIRHHIWDREGNRGTELAGKIVGLLGYGFMGRAVAEKMKALGCKVLAYDKYKQLFSDGYVQEASMDEIYESADIFSIHVPLTSETKNLVDLNYLAGFKKPVYIVNTARGEILVLEDLLVQMDKGKIVGAALDVLENENIMHLSKRERITFDKIIRNDKVILSPHVAGWSFESYARINEVLIEKLRDFLTTFSR
ncbi:MAG: NAD(P)-dependent oxidoreductase [Bacteroidota bacterium]